MQTKQIQAEVKDVQFEQRYIMLQNVTSQLNDNDEGFTVSWEDDADASGFSSSWEVKSYAFKIKRSQQSQTSNGLSQGTNTYHEEIDIKSFSGASASRSFTFPFESGSGSRFKYEITIYRVWETINNNQVKKYRSVQAYPTIELISSSWSEIAITEPGVVLGIPDVELGYEYTINPYMINPITSSYYRTRSSRMDNIDIAIIQVAVTSAVHRNDTATLTFEYPSFGSGSIQTVTAKMVNAIPPHRQDITNNFPKGITIFTFPLYVPTGLYGGSQETVTFNLNGVPKETFTLTLPTYQQFSYPYIKYTLSNSRSRLYQIRYYQGSFWRETKNFVDVTDKDLGFYDVVFSRRDLNDKIYNLSRSSIDMTITGKTVVTNDIHALEFGARVGLPPDGRVVAGLGYVPYNTFVFDSGYSYQSATRNEMRLNNRKKNNFTLSDFSDIAEILQINNMYEIYNRYKIYNWEFEFYHLGHDAYNSNLNEPWDKTSHRPRIKLNNLVYYDDIRRSVSLIDQNYIKLLKAMYIEILWTHTRVNNSGPPTDSSGTHGKKYLYDFLTLALRE